MKKLLLLILVLIGALIGLIFLVAIPKAEEDINAHLDDFGFKNAQIHDTSIGLKDISIGTVILGLNGQSTINDLKINLNWLTYLFQGKIDSITIEMLDLNNTTENIRNIIAYKKRISLKKISAIPAQKIDIKKALWNTATPQGIMSFEASALFKKDNDNDQHRLTASILAQQPALSFHSQWSGTVDSKNNIQVEGSFNDFGMAHGSTEIHRGTGWLTYQEIEGDATLAGQIEAGSGRIFAIPVNNIALIIGQEKDYYPVLLRAQASGIPDVRLSMDMHYARKIEDQSFESMLSIKRPSAFFEYLKHQNILDKEINQSSYNNVATDISLSYLSEKRFADGPIPFALKINQKNKNALDGIFLIYPRSLDVRGTAEIKAPLTNLIQSLFPIKEKNISDNVIRIDGNLKSFAQSDN